jgi:hypothetical protein
VVDLAPIKERLAKCIRLFGSAERANARIMTERALESVGASWTDLGDWIEHTADGKYTEDEMQQFALAVRKEGVSEGIKIGKLQAQMQQRSNGHITLPEPLKMAQYCHERLGRLKDDKQRDFVSDMYVITRRGICLSPGRLGYLASIYIQIGGKT